MYSILDIETTGGKYNEEGITEIAIYRYDGHKVTDQFISLVNPERPIQPFVVNLTGISNEMLRKAPKFHELAKRIVEITQDTILVAHNAQFDYRILRTEFARLGYDFERRTLCTVSLSQALIPDQKSYSLGKLVRALGIPISSRHRADGDAQATLKLFKLLLTKDHDQKIVSENLRTFSQKPIDHKLLKFIAATPTTTGVYYLHREDGTIVYIGQSKNIKKRLTQHFTSESKKSIHLQRETAKVTYQNTGSELLALLKANDEIKRIKPKYNKSVQKKIFEYALYEFVDNNGYRNIKIGKADGRKKEITTFSTLPQAKTFLQKAVSHYKLYQKFAQIEIPPAQNADLGSKKRTRSTATTETAETYNIRVEQLIDKHSFKNKSLVISDKGREIDERTAILIEEGLLKGYGFYKLNHQIHNLEILKTMITPISNSRDAQYILHSHLRKNKRLKIIPLSPTS